MQVINYRYLEKQNKKIGSYKWDMVFVVCYQFGLGFFKVILFGQIYSVENQVEFQMYKVGLQSEFRNDVIVKVQILKLEVLGLNFNFDI